MSKNRPNLPPRDPGSARGQSRLGLGLRILISVALLWHLLLAWMRSMPESVVAPKSRPQHRFRLVAVDVR